MKALLMILLAAVPTVHLAAEEINLPQANPGRTGPAPVLDKNRRQQELFWTGNTPRLGLFPWTVVFAQDTRSINYSRPVGAGPYKKGADNGMGYFESTGNLTGYTSDEPFIYANLYDAVDSSKWPWWAAMKTQPKKTNGYEWKFWASDNIPGQAMANGRTYYMKVTTSETSILSAYSDVFTLSDDGSIKELKKFKPGRMPIPDKTKQPIEVLWPVAGWPLKIGKKVNAFGSIDPLDIDIKKNPQARVLGDIFNPKLPMQPAIPGRLIHQSPLGMWALTFDLRNGIEPRDDYILVVSTLDGLVPPAIIEGIKIVK